MVAGRRLAVLANRVAVAPSLTREREEEKRREEEEMAARQF
jgi:hypothetical protein